MKAGLFSDAFPVEGNSIIPASIRLNVPFLNQHRALQGHFWVPWVTMPYFSQPEEGDYCLPRQNLHECVLGGDGQWAHHVPTISDRCSGSAEGEEKKKKCSGEKREPTEGSLILLIVHSTSLIAWDCAAKERMQWQIQWLLAGEGCCARAVRFPLWCVVVLGFVLAWTLSMPGSGGKEVSDFTKSYEAPVEIDPTIPKVRATHECMSSLSRAPISRVYNRT